MFLDIHLYSARYFFDLNARCGGGEIVQQYGSMKAEAERGFIEEMFLHYRKTQLQSWKPNAMNALTIIFAQSMPEARSDTIPIGCACIPSCDDGLGGTPSTAILKARCTSRSIVIR